jgi:glycosyltransferase involved in cell wall biosynthesis
MRIGHFHYGIYRRGGICSYIKSISQAETALGNEIFLFETDIEDHPEEDIKPIKVQGASELLAAAKSLKLDILHIHATLFDKMPTNLPIVYTVHTNAPHCPGGSLYLSRSEAPCPRSYSLTGCFVNHFTEHCGSIRPQKMLAGFRRRHLESQILPRSQIVAVSNFIKQKMLNSGYDGDNIEVLHNFVTVPSETVEAESLHNGETPIFLYFGRLQPNKGVQWLIKSFAQTAQPSRLVIAGSGTMEQQLKKLAVDCGVSGRVSFFGWMDNADLGKIIKTATAVVVPSLWPEPFGLVAIEAGAAEKPVIASSAGALSEIVEHEITGILVDAGDESGLRAAIDRLASNPGFAKQMGVQGKLRVEAEFSLHKHLNRLHEIYEGVIIRSGRSGFETIQAQ